MKVQAVTVVVFLLSALMISSVFAQSEQPQKVHTFVNDYAGVLSQEEVQQISAIAQALYEQKVAQYAVLIVQSLNGSDIESFSYNQANGILGDEQRNNGLLLVIAIEDKQYRFEVGKGLEPILNDARVGRLGRTYLAPHFRLQQYGQGIISASQAMSDMLVNNVEVPEEKTPDLRLPIFIAFTFILIITLLIFKRLKQEQKYFKAAKNANRTFGGFWVGGGRGGSGSSGGFGGFGGGGFGGGGASGGW